MFENRNVRDALWPGRALWTCYNSYSVCGNAACGLDRLVLKAPEGGDAAVSLCCSWLWLITVAHF